MERGMALIWPTTNYSLTIPYSPPVVSSLEGSKRVSNNAADEGVLLILSHLSTSRLDDRCGAPL